MQTSNKYVSFDIMQEYLFPKLRQLCEQETSFNFTLVCETFCFIIQSVE